MHSRCFLVVVLSAAASATACMEQGLHYTGSAACGECHGAAAVLVAGTAHPLAMQVAGDSSVLGRFGGVRAAHFGDTSEFRRVGDAWLVRTTGADGHAGDFEITHTLGIYPLQQYLVRFADGRYQVLPWAWDARPEAAGGQRWFHLYADEPITHTDELHWTGPQQNWNYMCAECHVTGLRRTFDLGTNSHDTRWVELGVGCEACHGPGSRHIAWAREWQRDSVRAQARYGPGAGFPVDLRAAASWSFDSGAATARSEGRVASHAQVETCAACHSRRETLVPAHVPGRPLLASHRPVLLVEGVYFADGQMQDEVYEYGSFLQSRMYRAGVTCSDCHHPSTQAVVPDNGACARCHRAEVFDRPAHHFHETGSAGARCVACHMPPRTYMVVDPRHDHSIRSPRPDLSLRIGTPNACTTCHSDRTADWAARIMETRYGPFPPERHYGEVLHAGRHGEAGADTALVRLAADTAVAGIVRATAVSLLERYAGRATAQAIHAAAHDSEPLVRLAAAGASAVLPPAARLEAAAHLLRDTLLAIRIEAARVLAPVPEAAVPAGLRAAFRAAAAEYVAALMVNADRPESHVRLGLFHLQRGSPGPAEQQYRHAIRVDPRHPAGYLNLADLQRARGREAEAEAVLREGIARAHRPAALHHGLGLLLIRTGRRQAALPELARAVELEPTTSRFAHVYALALHAAGSTAEAEAVLELALRRAPWDRDVAATLASLRRPLPEP